MTSSNAQEQIEREEREARQAQIDARAAEIRKAQKAVNQRISSNIRGHRSTRRGVITNKTTHQQINDAIRGAAGKGS